MSMEGLPIIKNVMNGLTGDLDKGMVEKLPDLWVDNSRKWNVYVFHKILDSSYTSCLHYRIILNPDK